MKLVSGDPAEMTVLHAGYVLQQCFDVALPAHIETLVGLWHRFPSVNFLDGVLEPLIVTPSTSVAFSGPRGGPFSPPLIEYQISASTGTVSYSIRTPSWLTAS